MSELLILGIICGFLGSVCSSMAKRRGKNPVLGYIAGFLFGIFAVFYYFSKPKIETKKEI